MNRVDFRNESGGGMMRVIMTLAVMASFNAIALQLFMTGNFGPLARVVSMQQAMLLTSFIVIIIDIVIVYFMITFQMSTTPAGEDFDRLFRKYYNGKNPDEAFEKAKKDWLKRMA